MQTAGRGNNKTYNNNNGYGIQMELLKYIKTLKRFEGLIQHLCLLVLFATYLPSQSNPVLVQCHSAHDV